MSNVVIWHNPRCSKSRQTLALIEAQGLTPEVRLYLQDAPDTKELHAAMALLGLRAATMMRLKDALARDLLLTEDDPEADLVAAMAAHPALIERPIVFANGRAAMGRPPEAVLSIL